ncbi:hypothetical protein FRC07_004040 [Ceratobasidium sp. 392]|nr:hypothetical protein FRC07_004040 [Ceratobasidium sp. 392]
MPPTRDNILKTSQRKKSSGLVLATQSPAPWRELSSPAATPNHLRYAPYEKECKTLKIEELHAMQKAVIDSIVADPKQDRFVIAATGSGKSLLFELPAILPKAEGKVTIVFIPRVSIIRIELKRLESCGIRVEARYKKNNTNASSELEAQNLRLFKAFSKPNLLPQLILVTPHQLEHAETTFQDILVQLYERGLIERFVFDEIHMLLDHHQLLDRLSNLRNKFPSIPVTLLSASLSPSTCKNLGRILNLNTCPTIFPLDRPNIYYMVEAKYSSGDGSKDVLGVPKQKEISQLVPIINLATAEYPTGSGLVYCRSRNTCKKVARFLSEAGVPSEPYDSEFGDTEAGAAVFNKWIQNDPTVRILVSTVALSSGVHKPDVRFVVHWSLPTAGIDGYMQETGRAGRDGDRATCLLLYAFDDAFKVRFDTQSQADNMYALLRLINFSNCRRRSLLSYYNDEHFPYGIRNARCCDVCDSRDGCFTARPSLNVTPIASRALRYYERQKGSMGAQKLAEALHKDIDTGMTVEMWKKIVQLLIIERYLEKERSGEQGGGQVKLVRSSRTNNLLRNGGHQVWLPWSMRFREHHLGEPNKDRSLLWTEELVEKLSETDVDAQPSSEPSSKSPSEASSRGSSPEL